jgi:hypothetical protein
MSNIAAATPNVTPAKIMPTIAPTIAPTNIKAVGFAICQAFARA